MTDVTYAVDRIRQELSEDANIIFGTTIDETMGDKFRVSIVATGIDVNTQFTTAVSNMESSQPNILFGENAETSENFLNALKTEGMETENPPIPTATPEVENPPIPTTTLEAETPASKSTQDIVHTQGIEQKIKDDIPTDLNVEQPDMSLNTDTVQKGGTPSYEVNLANTTFNTERVESVVENRITEENEAKGGFFKRLFGGIQETKEQAPRKTPQIETQASQQRQPNPPVTSTPQNNYEADRPEQTNKHDEDMDIPDFLKKQID